MKNFDVKKRFCSSVIDPREEWVVPPSLHGVLDGDDVLLSLDHTLGQVRHGEANILDVIPDS